MDYKNQLIGYNYIKGLDILYIHNLITEKSITYVSLLGIEISLCLFPEINANHSRFQIYHMNK